MPFIFGLPGLVWGFLRRLTWQQVLAGAVAVGGWLLWTLGQRKGRKGAEAKQEQANMENYIDVQKTIDDAKIKAARDVGALSDDDLNERLSKHPGAFRE